MDVLIVTYKNATGLLGTLISVIFSAATWGLMALSVSGGFVGGALLAYKYILLK